MSNFITDVVNILKEVDAYGIDICPWHRTYVRREFDCLEINFWRMYRNPYFYGRDTIPQTPFICRKHLVHVLNGLYCIQLPLYRVRQFSKNNDPVESWILYHILKKGDLSISEHFFEELGAKNLQHILPKRKLWNSRITPQNQLRAIYSRYVTQSLKFYEIKEEDIPKLPNLF